MTDTKTGVGPARRLTAGGAAVLLLILSACNVAPKTDIIATTTEDVGRFYVESANSEQRLTGHVCVEKPRHEAEIVRRLIQQLANHQYRSIDLAVYSKEAPIANYRWTPAALEREALSGPTNPCSAADDEAWLS